MAVRNALLGGAAVVAVVAAVWLYRDNRRLEDELATARRSVAAADRWANGPTVSADGPTAAARPSRFRLPLPRLGGNDPAAPPAAAAAEAPTETRGERRQRRQRELADLLGRDPGESEEDYKARILPLMQLALERPRANVDEMRKVAEAAAKVSDEQRQQLDAAFEDVYAELIDYTNGAIGDGQLTPYERNVQGMLQYAGGLGAILENAEGRIGKILSADQIRTMSETGFEWGEYLGVRAPWEQLRAPPQRPGT